MQKVSEKNFLVEVIWLFLTLIYRHKNNFMINENEKYFFRLFVESS